MSPELVPGTELVVYSGNELSDSSSWVERLLLIEQAGFFKLRQVRSEGSEIKLIYESDEFNDGIGFWEAFDQNATYGGLDDHQIVMEKINLIRRYASGLGDDIASEFRRRYE